MAVQITYSDLDVDLTRNSFTGDASMKTDLNAIRQSIQNILLTRKGERPFQPNLGSEIDNFMFDEPSSFLTTISLKSRIESVINKFDPRVTFEDFTFLENLSTGDEAHFELTYKVKTVGSGINQINTTEIADGITITVDRS